MYHIKGEAAIILKLCIQFQAMGVGMSCGVVFFL